MSQSFRSLAAGATALALGLFDSEAVREALLESGGMLTNVGLVLHMRLPVKP